MKKIFLYLLIILIFSCCKNTKSEKYFESMNTFMKVQCYGKKCDKANEEAQRKISELENLISVTKPQSEIYKINTAKQFPVVLSEQTASLIKFSLEMANKTEGAFNPCLYPISSLWGFTKKNYIIPSEKEIKNALNLIDYKKVFIEDCNITMAQGMMIDLGGIGKGFAGDEAIKILKEYDIKSALLDLGGNVQVIGTKPDGSDWSIGIRNPLGQIPLGILKVNNCAVITSGGYERFFVGEDGKKYIHIFDGKTGYPVKNNILSTTAIGKTGVYCDALSTSLLVMGIEKAIKFWNENNNFDFIIVTNEKEIYITNNISENFTLNSDLKDFTLKIIN